MKLSPETPSTVGPMSRWIPGKWPLLGGALVGIPLRLIYSGAAGHYYATMMSPFMLLVPAVVGAVAVYLAERTARRSWSFYFSIGAGANALFVLGTFLILIEGLICVVLAIPLFMVIGGFGGLAMGAVCRFTRWPGPTTYGLAVLPLLLGGLEPRGPQPGDVHVVERDLRIAASPAQVWPQLMRAEHIRPDEMQRAWMYRIGVPLPLSAITTSSDNTQVREIRMGRGVHFEQIAAEWEPNRRVRWVYHFSADSFPVGALDDHVRIGGTYFDVLDTEYLLQPVADGTSLHVRMRYRVSTAFNWYAAPIARWLVGDFEETALAFYARRAVDGTGNL